MFADARPRFITSFTVKCLEDLPALFLQLNP
jgi:hypothetical protein